jgi:hypothetical protein
MVPLLRGWELRGMVGLRASDGAPYILGLTPQGYNRPPLRGWEG